MSNTSCNHLILAYIMAFDLDFETCWLKTPGDKASLRTYYQPSVDRN